MTKKLKISGALASLALCIFLEGCTSWRDLTVNEMRTEEFYYKTAHLNKNLKEIEEILKAYPNSCRPLYVKINTNSNNTSGSIVWSTGGFSNLATMAVMDFKENENKTSTEVKIYSSSMWKKRPDKILKILETNGQCQD